VSFPGSSASALAWEEVVAALRTRHRLFQHSVRAMHHALDMPVGAGVDYAFVVLWDYAIERCW
jgi:hypothetical protein